MSFVSLLHRRGSKWNVCWYAATQSESFFKRRYHVNSIENIDIEETCEVILEIVEQRNRRSTYRFSLRLSSQLMYGVTKLWHYQVKHLEKEVFDIKFKIRAPLQQNRDTFDAVHNLEYSATETPINLNFNVFKKDLHLLPDVDLNFRLQTLPAKYQNFGDLTDEDLENLQDSQTMREFFLSGMIRKKDDICQEQADTENIKDFLEISVSLTPQKRHPREMLIETPTKRRRLFLEAALPIPEDNEAVCQMEPISDLPVEELRIEELCIEELPVDKPATLPFPEKKTELDLEPSRFVISKHLKKNKIIDKEISLNSDMLRKWYLNTNIHCKPFEKQNPPRLLRVPAKTLLKQPLHFPTRWNSCLRKRFTDRITELSLIDNVAPERISPSGQLRAGDTVSNVNLPSQTATLGITDIANNTKQSDFVNISPQINLIHENAIVADVAPILEEKPNSVTLENTEFVDNIETVEGVSLTTREILAMLEVLWEKSENVEFTELISPASYSKKDASTAFEILLDLHANQKIFLIQKDFHQSLKIQKDKNN